MPADHDLIPIYLLMKGSRGFEVKLVVFYHEHRAKSSVNAAFSPTFLRLIPNPTIGHDSWGRPILSSKLETVKRANYKDESPIPLGNTPVQSSHIRNILKRFKVTLLVKS